jgi:glycosyltransferase involved in cell wall biosynthesis
MTSSQLVSVIITCHNQQQCIEQAIGSVTAQSHREIECLVVDDGSTDESASVIRRFAANDERIRLIATPNCGVTAARNTGFREAHGAFIQFLDGDDTLESEKLSLQLKHLESDPSTDVSYTNHQFYNESTDTHHCYAFDALDDYPLEQMLFKYFDGVSLPLHAPLYRRSVWGGDELPYPDDYNERCEDWVFLVLVAMKNVRFAYLDKVLCTYCIQTNNFTNSSRNWNVASILAAVYLNDRIPEQYRDRFLGDTIGRTLDRYHETMKPAVLQASKNWQIGNFLSRPFFRVAKLFRRKPSGETK